MFKCQRVQEDYYLVADFRIKCFVGVWWGYAVVAAAGAILYTVGIPLFLFLLLQKNRQHLYIQEIRKKNDDNNFSKHALVVRKYGPIYSAYNPDSYFFDLLDMIRRLLLTGGLILLGQTSNVQIFLGGLLCTCWLLIVAVKRPYVAFWDNVLSVLLSFQLLIVILSGMALEIYRLTPLYAQDPYQRNAFGVFLVIACLMVIVTAVVAIVVSVPFVRNRFVKRYQKYKAQKREREKKKKKKKNPGEVPSSGKENDKSKDDGGKKKELKEVGTKDLINELIQRFPGSKNINIKDHDEILKRSVKMFTVMMKDFVSENLKKKALEVQAQVQRQVESIAKKNVYGAAVVNSIKGKTEIVKSKYLWSDKEEKMETLEKEGEKETKQTKNKLNITEEIVVLAEATE